MLQGAAGSQAILTAARPLADALYDLLRETAGAATPEQRATLRHRLEDAARRIPDRALASEYRRVLLDRFYAARNSDGRNSMGRNGLGRGSDGGNRDGRNGMGLNGSGRGGMPRDGARFPPPAPSLGRSPMPAAPTASVPASSPPSCCATPCCCTTWTMPMPR